MDNPSFALTLLQTLLRCPSVTPHDAGALVYLERVLKDAGFDTHQVTFSQPDTPDVENLYACIGATEPVFLFAGHTDVVPAGDTAAWRHDPFSGTIDNGMVYGRGASDMKGGVACSIAAALSFLKKYPEFKGSIAFLLTGDEEGPAVNGSVKLLEWAQARGERFDVCLLAEPTNPSALGDMIKIGRRGSLSGFLTVHGKQGHVAYPQNLENPIPGMVRLIDGLIREPLDSGTAHFEPSNLEFTTVDVGNPAQNVIPAKAQATFNVRFNDAWTPATLATELRKRLEAAAGNSVRYSIEFEDTNADAFVTRPGPFTQAVAEAVEAETGRRPAFSTGGGTSDARFIQNYCPVVEFGLVNATMHQVNEAVAIADVDQLTAIYERVLQSYFRV